MYKEIKAISLLLLMALAIYGMRSWFYPSETYVLYATFPAVIIGIWFSFLICKYINLNKIKKIRKPLLCLGTVFIIPYLTWAALVMGMPSLITLGLTPNFLLMPSLLNAMKSPPLLSRKVISISISLMLSYSQRSKR